MVARRFDELETDNNLFPFPCQIKMSPEGPQRFIPVFDTYEQAVVWNDGKTDNITPLQTLEEKCQK